MNSAISGTIAIVRRNSSGDLDLPSTVILALAPGRFGGGEGISADVKCASTTHCYCLLAQFLFVL
jgi:hypothetical protein